MTYRSFALLLSTLVVAGGAWAATAEPAAATAAPSRCHLGEIADGAADLTLRLAGWPDRSFDLQLPPGHRCGTPIGLVVVLHGGGGNKDNMRPLTCPDGDVRSNDCLDRRILAAGMAVVFADGTRSHPNLPFAGEGFRTWNAGGGQRDTNCVSGYACENGVDDIAYTRALLAELKRRVDIDDARIFATGFSNGAAMAHRLACEAAETFAAVVSVEGENQFELNGCAPSARVAVLDIHGTADLCWPYESGPGGCISKDRYLGVGVTMAGWAARNGCRAAPVEQALPPRPGVDDGTRVVRFSYLGCAAGGRLEHLRVVGNGHYWPNGELYASPKKLGGTMSRQLDTSRAIVEFFAANGRR